MQERHFLMEKGGGPEKGQPRRKGKEGNSQSHFISRGNEGKGEGHFIARGEKNWGQRLKKKRKEILSLAGQAGLNTIQKKKDILQKGRQKVRSGGRQVHLLHGSMRGGRTITRKGEKPGCFSKRRGKGAGFLAQFPWVRQ